MATPAEREPLEPTPASTSQSTEKIPELADSQGVSSPLEDQAVDAMEEHSILTRSASTMADQVYGAMTIDFGDPQTQELRTLQGIYNAINSLDKDKNGLSRNELSIEIEKNEKLNPELSALQKQFLKNFGRYAGTDGLISDSEFNQAIGGGVVSTIERAAEKEQFGVAERSAIAQWAGRPVSADAAAAQEKELNRALEGTGIQAKVEFSTYKNDLGDEVPISTVTLTREGKQLDQFSFADKFRAREAMLAGQDVTSSITLLDNADPSKTMKPEMTQHIQEADQLLSALSQSNLTGAMSLMDVAKGNFNSKLDKYLQDNFARLAMIDGDGRTITNSELKIAAAEAIATMMKDSIARDGVKPNAVVEGVLRRALQQHYLGGSDVLPKALNAALKDQGYQASLSLNSDKHAQVPVTEQVLKIWSVNNANNSIEYKSNLYPLFSERNTGKPAIINPQRNNWDSQGQYDNSQYDPRSNRGRQQRYERQY
ncbi:MAG: hypothetical protein C0507_16055 [Cyanobacteria bacterium PR.3.49]|nr:hypothetical protein [Cyanobacteria bacterium PR.3.49]